MLNPDAAQSSSDVQTETTLSVTGAATARTDVPALEDWTFDAIYTCEQCQSRLTAERVARFCPTCGYEIATDALSTSHVPWQEMGTRPPCLPGVQPTVKATQPEQRAIAREDIVAAIAHWQSLLEQLPEEFTPERRVEEPRTPLGSALSGEPAAIPFTGIHHPSSIVTAYANAMYRLGLAYEARLGHSYNLHEAARCYLKSARLGNLDALNRVHGIPFIPTSG